MKLIGVGFLLLTGVGVHAQSAPGPQLVTQRLPLAIQGQPYSASLLIGSPRPLTQAAITGLPAGLIAAHNGSGSIAISGTPTMPGSFALNVTARDTPPNSIGVSLLNTSVNLTVYQVARNVTTVSAGSNHSCAMVDGGVQCWGNNDIGQLGNNSTTQSLLPVPTIPAGSNVTSLSAGDDHACAVVNGGVRCWGITGIDAPVVFPNPPVRSRNLVPTLVISPGNGVTSVSTGIFHSCALINGGVQCWGGNSSGQLGNNSTTPSELPVQAIAAGSNVTSVSTGGFHSCALINGGVQCWGSNFNGQLGDNTTTQSLVPVQAIAVGSGATSVSTGSYHSCAVVNGGVQCWGNNSRDRKSVV